MTFCQLPRAGRRAFTLIEMLVSLAVLSLMLVAIATATNYITRVWLDGVGTVDNFTKARLMLNIMDRDIQMMVLRRDLPAFTDSTGTQSLCAFYTMQQGNIAPVSTGSLTSPDARAISLVQYSLSQLPTAATATATLLQRNNCGMNFLTTSGMSPAVGNTTTGSVTTSSGTLLLTTGSLTQLTTFTGTSTGTLSDNVATGVIAFQWQFLDGTGAVLTPPYTPTGSSSTTTYPFAYDFLYPGDSDNPRAVIISMLVLSNPAYTMAIQTGTLPTLIGCFSSSNAPLSSTAPTYGQAWNAALASPSSTFLGLPSPERHGIEVFQRYIPLPITTPSS